MCLAYNCRGVVSVIDSTVFADGCVMDQLHSGGSKRANKVLLDAHSTSCLGVLFSVCLYF
jgi:hypothetical protein